MRRVFACVVALSVLSVPAMAVECPKELNPCKVIFLTPQQQQWLAGTQQSSSGSILDAATKALGSDAAGVVAQVLFQARAAVDGTPPQKADDKPKK